VLCFAGAAGAREYEYDGEVGGVRLDAEAAESESEETRSRRARKASWPPPTVRKKLLRPIANLIIYL
jgi:hypothetical protein